MSVQVPSGVVDIAVADEAEAIRAARKYLVLFPGIRLTASSVPISASCARSSRKTGCAFTTSGR